MAQTLPAPSQAASAPTTSPAPASPVDALPTVTHWNCEPSLMDSRGQPAGAITEQTALTVGDKFLLTCQGPIVDLDRDHLALELPKQAKYALRIMETRALTADHAEFIATSWIAAPVEFKQLYLSDGKNKVDIGPLAIAMKSVIPKDKQAEPKPFDPWGPLRLGLPIYVWITIAIVVALIGLWAAYLIGKMLKRKRFLSLLNKNQIALTPYNQFNKDLRRFARQPLTASAPESFAKELSEAFRWYLARELFVPAVGASTTFLLRDMARRHESLYKKVSRDLGLALREIDQAKELKPEDVHQLIELCRSLADRIHAGKGSV